MILWRNVFIALLAADWAHGLGAAIAFSLGADAVCGFCVAVAVVGVIALIPVGIAAHEQTNSIYRTDADNLRWQLRQLRAELAERELKEPLP